VNLSDHIVVYSGGTWNDEYGQESGSTSQDFDVPGIPSIYLNGIDASNPYQTRLYYGTTPNGFQSLYSSVVVIGGQNAFSYALGGHLKTGHRGSPQNWP
jgi:hypothetical protein